MKKHKEKSGTNTAYYKTDKREFNMQSSINTPTYTDFTGFDTMRSQARVNPQSSLEKVAKQFEGIFIQMMLKSMRDASFGDPIFDSNQSKFYRDMFDQQVALDMSNSKGIGLADAMVRQLSGNLPSQPGNEKDSSTAAISVQNSLDRPVSSGKTLPPAIRMAAVDRVYTPGLSSNELSPMRSVTEATDFNSPEDFVNRMMPHAEQAAEELGVSPFVLVAQAALETGWGKSITRRPDGSSSYNVFNIKADNRWDGSKVTKSTLEYYDGKARYEKASFRAYDSFADSFNDYVDFLRSNSRYDSALQHNGDDQQFIEDLQKAGYATDPSYANKVLNILGRNSIQVHVDKAYQQGGVDGIV